MARRLWLLLAQTITVLLGAVIVLRFFGLGFEADKREVVTLKEVVQSVQAPLSTDVPTLTLRAAARKATRSVVNVYTRTAARRGLKQEEILRWRFFGEEPQRDSQPVASLGSGVVVSADGYILTNNHVIEGADEIAVVTYTGQSATAKIVGRDPESDLAVLKVGLKGLEPISLADSSAIQIGDFVLAIGNPFGVGQTVTMGVVSATGRSRLGINQFEDFIQTDASINPGNSGGALTDAQGNLIGINTAIFSQSGGSEGIGFAIPLSLARRVMEQIIATGSVVRGWLGVELQAVSEDVARALGVAKASGVLVSGVVRGGPADRGGVRPGDVVTGINSSPVEDSTALLNAVAAVTPGQSVELTVTRDRKPLQLRVTVGRRPLASKS